MPATEIPQKVQLTCDHCGHQWLESVTVIIGSRELIYRSDTQTSERRVICPNCNDGVIVAVPQSWLEQP